MLEAAIEEFGPIYGIGVHKMGFKGFRDKLKKGGYNWADLKEHLSEREENYIIEVLGRELAFKRWDYKTKYLARIVGEKRHNHTTKYPRQTLRLIAAELGGRINFEETLAANPGIGAKTHLEKGTKLILVSN